MADVTAATGPASVAWLLFAVPLAAAGILLLLGRRADKWGHWLAVAASWFSFFLGAAILWQMLQTPPSGRRMSQILFSWMPVGDFHVNLGTLVDPLSMTFVMLVTLVGSLILVYSVGYMENDPDRRRFFAYLALFIASMLILVLGNSYASLFLGWEGVGLSSYLLIGFWNQVPTYATAAKKAFVMNRVGDIGLLIAMMAMVANFASVDFTAVNEGVAGIPQAQATIIGLALLLAATGKSAQFPLQAWLGDAMAGPTPVSALIHAATMVTAGVYLIVRSGAVFLATPVAMTAVSVVALITLIMGALIGTAKDDIKKVLAASTMSQIGYMMLGASLGPIGWGFAIFLLLAHGFFKALLFLDAGSVMHAMNDETNIRRFGGLSKYMKITWLTFMAGWLAILGIVPFSGYWTKDRIIEAAFAANHFGNAPAPWAGWVYGGIALIGAAITSFYMSRLFFMTFYGKPRWEDQNPPVEPHEPGPIMTVPLIILAVFSLGLGGALAGGRFVGWLAPSIGETPHADPVVPALAIEVVTTVLVVLAAALAWYMFAKKPVPVAVPEGNALVRAARNDFYQDEVNEALFAAPSIAVMTGVVAADKYGVDGTVNGISAFFAWLGRVVARTESGYVRAYASYILGGVVIVLAVVLGFRL